MPAACAKAPTCMCGPLNYIDVFSRMQLEELLRACRPAMLLVEHDQAFLEGLADKRVKLVPA